MNPDLTSQVLAALSRMDTKIDDIRESVAQARSGIASLDSWREGAQEQAKRSVEKADELEGRVREQEAFSARIKVYVAIAAAVCSVVASGCVGLVLQYVK